MIEVKKLEFGEIASCLLCSRTNYISSSMKSYKEETADAMYSITVLRNSGGGTSFTLCNKCMKQFQDEVNKYMEDK